MKQTRRALALAVAIALALSLATALLPGDAAASPAGPQAAPAPHSAGSAQGQPGFLFDASYTPVTVPAPAAQPAAKVPTAKPAAAKPAPGKQLATRALQFRGVPYRWAGMSSRGMDCSGLVARVLLEHGIRAPHNSAALFKLGTRIRFRQLAAGDLLFFNTTRRGISHVGIFLGEGKFVHASSVSRGVITSSLYEPYYSRRLVGARRLK